MIAALEPPVQYAPMHGKTAPAASLDPGDLAHLVIEGLFSLVFPDPHARQRLGLRAISRARLDTMTWYFWTTLRLGAFEAALLPGCPEAHPDGALIALRYFPDPGEGVFARFAAVEQQARLSPLFDQTGTPTADGAQRLDPSLFHVGTLEIMPQGPHHIGLSFSAQDRWLEQVCRKDGWHIRRDVPGLRLALGVVDPLVCGLSYLGRRPPALVRAWRYPGLTWSIEANGQAHSREEPGIAAWEIELHGLVVPGYAGWAGPAPLPMQAVERPRFEYADAIPPRHAPWPVSERWWQATGWQFDPVGEFCSQCAAEAHDHHPHSHPILTRSTD